MKPIVSIVLCTYNNADSLQLTLTQLAQQQVPDAKDIEIIVVNNNSSDHTEAVIKPFLSHSLFSFRYLFEKHQGLSLARNTGVAGAQGDYVLFTDDDAEIPGHWVNAYLKTIQHHHPDCLYSKINIIWDRPKPWWFLPEYNSCFVGLNYGDSLLHISNIHREFYGKNFCIRKNVLQEMGGFDPKLGRNGNHLGAGEETLLYRRLITARKEVVYFPDAPIGHRLKPSEYQQKNIRKLFLDSASSQYYIATLVARKKILGRPLGLLLRASINLATALIKLPLSAVSLNKARVYYHLLCTRKNLVLIKLWISTP